LRTKTTAQAPKALFYAFSFRYSPIPISFFVVNTLLHNSDGETQFQAQSDLQGKLEVGQEKLSSSAATTDAQCAIFRAQNSYTLKPPHNRMLIMLFAG
jgi:hypothetical protein